MQLLCALYYIYMLRLTPRVQRLVTTDLSSLQSFCQTSPLLRNASPYLLSHSEEARTEWDKLQITESVGFNSAFDMHSILFESNLSAVDKNVSFMPSLEAGI